MQPVVHEVRGRQQSHFGDRVVPISTIISVIALLVSFGVAWRTMSHDPLGQGLGAYDLSTPKAALFSHVKIIENSDYRAILESSGKFDARRAAEKLRTLEIHRESAFRGSKILFISYEENGIKNYDVAAFQKDAESGKWTPSYTSVFNLIAEDVDGNATPEEKKLSHMTTKWCDKGEFE